MLIQGTLGEWVDAVGGVAREGEGEDGAGEDEQAADDDHPTSEADVLRKLVIKACEEGCLPALRALVEGLGVDLNSFGHDGRLGKTGSR